MAEEVSSEFLDYNTISNNDRVNHEGKLYTFDTKGTTKFGRYRIFESRDPNLVPGSTVFTGLKPILVSEDEVSIDNGSDGDVVNEVKSSIDLTTISEVGGE